MDIETELTPNPETLKFIVDKKFIFQYGIEIKNEKEAKEKNITWSILKTKILTFMLDSISSNKVLIEKKSKNKEVKRKKDKISNKIEKIIDEKVRPAVARDGGDIIFESFDKGVVYLKLKGACSGCPSSTATLKDGIENLLTHYSLKSKK